MGDLYYNISYSVKYSYNRYRVTQFYSYDYSMYSIFCSAPPPSLCCMEQWVNPESLKVRKPTYHPTCDCGSWIISPKKNSKKNGGPFLLGAKQVHQSAAFSWLSGIANDMIASVSVANTVFLNNLSQRRRLSESGYVHIRQPSRSGLRLIVQYVL